MKKKFILLSLICVLKYLTGIDTASAQWQSVGPEGGYIKCMTQIGPTIFAIVNPAKLYSSSDNGNTWVLIASPEYINAITALGNSLFVSTNEGIYRSDDYGLTWVQKYNLGAGYMTVSGSSLFAANGAYSGILRSTDNGENWTVVNEGLSDTYLYSLTASNTAIFAGTGIQMLGVFRSTDNGDTWQQVKNGMAYYFEGEWYPDYAPVISSLGFNGNDLYAGTTEGQGMWKSSDNGDNWVLTNPETMNYEFRNAIIGNGTTVFASTYAGVLKSSDNGATWATANTGINCIVNNFGYINSFIIKDANVFIGTGDGIYKTVNNGATWTMSYSGIRALEPIYQTSSFSSIGSDIYFGGALSGVFHSSDNGANWTNVHPRSTLSELYSTTSVLFADDKFSTDEGDTWQVTTCPGYGLHWIEQGSAFFAFSNYGTEIGVYRSLDNGATWSMITNGISSPGEAQYSCLNSDGETLFLGTSTGVYHSVDNGENWIVNESPFPNFNVAAFYGAKYVSTETADIYGLAGGGGIRGIYRSTDNGANWVQVHDLLVHKFVRSGNIIYVSGTNLELVDGEYVEVRRILSSLDNGQNWSVISSNLDNIANLSLAAEGSNVYVSIFLAPNHGVYRSSDNGATWINISQGLPQAYISSLHIVNNKIFAAANGASVWSRNLDEFYPPAQPSAIAGSETPCIGSSQIYSVTNVPGVSYTWQFPSDWVITGGNGTNSVTVTVGSVAGVILVIPSNAFGSGPAQTLIVNPVSTINAGVSIEADQNNICEGTLVNITAIPVEGGQNPVYQWFVNGIENEETGAVLTYNPTDNDEVYTLMTSSLGCVTNNPVQSNTIQFSVTDALEVIVSITEDKNDVCAGEIITFTASTTNGGNQPTYNWYVNETNVGDNSATFAYAPENGDIVSLVFTSSEWCVSQNPVTSNAIVAIVNALPEVSWNYTDPTTVCIEDWGPITLTGGLPEGGIYSGAGVSGNIFNQAVAGIGNHVISYTYTDSNNCSAEAQIEFTVDACLGVTESANGLLVYPNPANDNFTIKMQDNRAILEITVFNKMGICVYNEHDIKSMGTITIPVQNLPAGNYILKVTGNDETLIKSIILE
ncbi:MAG: T9SS type A sorting domain-containing protein [Bacteroidales bacterium]|nr:T9SS type A sorting domain-containing protein [Bacteroidales bacterium]